MTGLMRYFYESKMLNPPKGVVDKTKENNR